MKFFVGLKQKSFIDLGLIISKKDANPEILVRIATATVAHGKNKNVYPRKGHSFQGTG